MIVSQVGSYRLDRPEVRAWILDPNRVDAG
jgi:hypothetical protein